MDQANGRCSSYLPLHPIGSGAFGVVYKAEDLNTGEIVAVKKMPKNQETSRREIEILSSLKRHPCIIPFREVFYLRCQPEYAFMAMDMGGPDLQTRLRSLPAPLEESSARTIMASLLAGVLHLHRNGVIHRDLKTANVLASDEGEVKICDFGLACQIPDDDDDDEGDDDETFSGPVGTYGYIAPEILLKIGDYTPAVDMFSVGCIMAELVGKGPLFRRGESCEILHPNHHTLEQKLPMLSPNGLDLLLRLLCFDPSERITAEGALWHRWFRTPPPPRHHYNLRSRPHQPCPFRSTDMAAR